MRKQHVKERRAGDIAVPDREPLSPEQEEEQEDAKSLDLVQRLVISVLAFVVGGAITFVLSLTSALQPLALDRSSVIGLWVMSGITGLLTTAVILIINRRHSYSPFLVIGLVPMAVTAYWVFS